jgi:predicted Zn finger-like uncharacterized protein
MSEFRSHASGPSLIPIDRPRCPRCKTRSMLARVELGPSGYDLRTFDCPKCHHVFKSLVALDPMKSDTLGWLSGDLKSPK